MFFSHCSPDDKLSCPEVYTMYLGVMTTGNTSNSCPATDQWPVFPGSVPGSPHQVTGHGHHLDNHDLITMTTASDEAVRTKPYLPLWLSSRSGRQAKVNTGNMSTPHND